jgi:hypothetical protein
MLLLNLLVMYFHGSHRLYAQSCSAIIYRTSVICLSELIGEKSLENLHSCSLHRFYWQALLFVFLHVKDFQVSCPNAWVFQIFCVCGQFLPFNCNYMLVTSNFI